LILVEEGEIVLVENLEELLPGRFLELLVIVAEIETQNSAAALPGAYNRRPSAAFFGPTANLIVVGGGGGLAHRSAPRTCLFSVSTLQLDASSWRRPGAPRSEIHRSIISRMRIAKASTAKGLVIISMPGSRKPVVTAALSA
jgi:hypothetical protein